MDSKGLYTIKGGLWYATVDYLRATTVQGRGDILRAYEHYRAICLAGRGADLGGQRNSAERKMETENRYGLVGFADKSHFFGTGGWGSLIQVSGSRSQQAAAHLSLFTNVPRLDIQITSWPPFYTEASPKRCYEEYVVRREGKRRTASPIFIENKDGGDTLYVGKRGKDTRMLRIYEKSKQDKKEEPGAVRYEFELTGKVAFAAFVKLKRQNMTQHAVAAAVRGHLRELAYMDVECDGTEPVAPDRFGESEGDADSLKWLREQVAPHVKKLLEGGAKPSDIGQALGLSSESLAEMLVEAKKREEKSYRAALEMECPTGMS